MKAFYHKKFHFKPTIMNMKSLKIQRTLSSKKGILSIMLNGLVQFNIYLDISPSSNIKTFIYILKHFKSVK